MVFDNHNNPLNNKVDFQNKKISDRAIKGYSILAKGDIPQSVNEEMFLVPSQNNPSKKYRVTLRQSWSCDCPDHEYRKVKCKHIHAVEFLLKMREKVNFDGVIPIESEVINQIKCAYCGSANLKENGNRKTKGGLKQRYCCKDCKRTFIADKEFEKIKANPKIVTLTMDLYFKGLSLRDINDTIYQFYGLKISHETIRSWIMRFTKSMNDYVNKLKPELSDAWHVDEQMVMSKGRWVWSWNLLDEDTRFLIANAITERRNIKDARKVFKNAKEITNIKPDFIVSDGLGSYDKAIKKEFSPRKRISDVTHIKLESIRAKSNNNVLERYHSTFREFDKVRRGFKGQEKPLMDGFITYYNFIRKHQALSGLTPSQMANIDLKLGRNRWLSLLKKSLNNPEKQNTN